MTPGARVAAAIDCIDAISTGDAAERVLTNWARGARYAGAKDRAAVRDLVFDVLRRWWSTAAAGGGTTGRARLLGLLRQEGTEPDAIFTGAGHAPAPLSDVDRAAPPPPDPLAALDCPTWLAPRLRDSLGDAFGLVMERLRHRAPLFLRVNTARTDRAAAADALAQAGIDTRPVALAPHALEVLSHARQVARSGPYLDGRVEIQDAASQAIVEMLPVEDGAAVLDFCAGGGGKALALAARGARVTAHDADPGRMRDLPARAARAGVRIDVAERVDTRFPVVLADAPCSGSGAWRRAPEGKIRLDAARLDALIRRQDDVIDAALARVSPGGCLAYATCSLLDDENGARVAAALARHPGLSLADSRRLTPLDGGDGFYCAVLRKHR